MYLDWTVSFDSALYFSFKFICIGSQTALNSDSRVSLNQYYLFNISCVQFLFYPSIWHDLWCLLCGFTFCALAIWRFSNFFSCRPFGNYNIHFILRGNPRSRSESDWMVSWILREWTFDKEKRFIFILCKFALHNKKFIDGFFWDPLVDRKKNCVDRRMMVKEKTQFSSKRHFGNLYWKYIIVMISIIIYCRHYYYYYYWENMQNPHRLPYEWNSNKNQQARTDNTHKTCKAQKICSFSIIFSLLSFDLTSFNRWDWKTSHSFPIPIVDFCFESNRFSRSKELVFISQKY